MLKKYRETGFSEFVLLANDALKKEIDYMAEYYRAIVDIAAEYEIRTEKDKYWLLQLEVLFSDRSQEELCKFVYTYFPFIAMRQSGSTYILVSDREQFRTVLNDVYGKERKVYFLYDMLSIAERYNAACNTGVEIDPYSDNRLKYNENGNIYSLVFGPECIYLFSSDSEISIVDTMSGELKELDMIDGLWLFEFHIAILK